MNCSKSFHVTLIRKMQLTCHPILISSTVLIILKMSFLLFINQNLFFLKFFHSYKDFQNEISNNKNKIFNTHFFCISEKSRICIGFLKTYGEEIPKITKFQVFSFEILNPYRKLSKFSE